MALPIEQLAGMFPEARRIGDGFKVTCPCHEDTKPSLCINPGNNGGILLKCPVCHAGAKEVIASGMYSFTMIDLAPTNYVNGQSHPANGYPNAPWGNWAQEKFGAYVDSYNYTDEAGNIIKQVVRTDRKEFRQRHLDGRKWVWGAKGLRSVVYRLQKIANADPSETIYLLEGEKDVHTLESWGLLATCNDQGAEKFTKAHAECLRDRHIVIVPDNDNAGRRHRDLCLRLLKGVAASVRVLDLPNLPEKGDVTDWRNDCRGTKEQFLELVAGLEEASLPNAEAVPQSAVPRKKKKRAPAVAELNGHAHAKNSWPSIAFEEGRTDVANGRRLALKHGKNFRWIENWNGHLAWDGTRWSRDQLLAVDGWARDVYEGLWAELSEALKTNQVDEDEAQAIVRFIRATGSDRGIQAISRRARSEQGIAIAPDSLDNQPYYLNLPTATVDLKTGVDHEHRREDWLTQLCPTLLDPTAKCPTWEVFLQSVFQGDSNLIAYVHRAVGYCLTGDVSEHALFFCYGKGSNGKSTFLNTLIEMLGGDYAMKAASDLLLVKNGESHPTGIADLFGKRLVACIEADAGKRIAESMVKEVTGGDSIRARRMRQDFFEFKATHKIWLAANHKPTIRGTDDGIWRRIKMIPFLAKFEGEGKDRAMPEKLRAELPGILNWAIRGCELWMERGLQEPEAVKEATASYRGDMDIVGQFIAECCMTTEGLGLKAKASQLLNAFNKYSGNDWSTRRFGEEMSERGFEKRHSSGTWYMGIGLRSEG